MSADAKEKRKFESKGLIVTLAILLTCVLAFCSLFCNEVTITTPGSTHDLSNAKQLATACQLFAVAHGGKYPAKLQDVVGTDISQEYCESLKFRDFTGADGQVRRWLGIKVHDGVKVFFRRPTQEWLYFGVDTKALRPHQILIAAPMACRHARVVARVDTSAQVISDAMFLEELRNLR